MLTSVIAWWNRSFYSLDVGQVQENVFAIGIEAEVDADVDIASVGVKKVL